MQNPRLKKAGLSATLVIAVAVGAAAFSAEPAAGPRPLVAVASAVDAPTQLPASDDAALPITGETAAAAATSSRVAPSDEPVSGESGMGDGGAETGSQRSEPFARDYVEPPSSHIVVSIDKRWLWYIIGADTVLSAPVAVGMNSGFEFAGRSFHFKTPRGQRQVLRKEEDPVWTVPEWHYYERARQQGLEVVQLTSDSRIDLSDGTVLVVRGDEVGRINHFGNFWPFTPGNEIIFDGKVFVPPLHTKQRRVPDALGPYKLDMGNGYLIHGTHIYNEESVGRAVSHGCVRMSNADLERLYWMVDPGTPVVIR